MSMQELVNVLLGFATVSLIIIPVIFIFIIIREDQSCEQHMNDIAFFTVSAIFMFILYQLFTFACA